LKSPRFVLLIAALLAAAPAAGREIAIERFQVEAAIGENGRLDVAEVIRFRFTGSWNGVVRSIPIEYRTPQGMGYRLMLEPESISDQDGAPLRWESSRVRHYRELKIWVPGASDAVRTVVLRYRVANALRSFDTHDELYWNVTGDEWEMPIEDASATIRLPAAATGLRATAFTGAYGSQAQEADVTLGEREVQVRMRRPLAFREGLTVVVGWDKGAVRPPGALTRAGWFVRANWPLVVPLLAFAGMFALWRRIGRDPRRQPVAVRYEPPPDMTPAEAGTLLDHRVDMRDVTATLVDLAVRGFLEIEEKEEPVFLGLGRSTDYVFKRTRPEEEWNTLKAHEREVLGGLFRGGRAEVELSDLKNEFYRRLGPIRDGIYHQLADRGYYRHRPDQTRALFMIAGGVILFLSIHAAAFGSAVLGLPAATLGLAIALTGIVVLAVGWFMPARTVAGTRALESVLGYEEFVGRVEADRLDRMVLTPQTFERGLPYAMAFGVEERWARAFRDVMTEPPRWYRGTGGPTFDSRALSRSLGQLNSQAASVMASSPRGSGGSGFGGGGSSGGGFGGGGGRGF
jgi:uncharacterized membrane protein YgcG